MANVDSPKLPSFLADEELQLVLFGGKGGVGKTTCAAATAIQSGKSGRKTLLMSINPAHSLSDIFELEIGDEPTRVDECLYAVEINCEKLLEEYKKQYERQIKTVIDRGTPADPEDLKYFWDLSLPGIDEVMAMLKLMDFAKEGRHDLFVVDMAATGHIIRFLSLPALMKLTIDILRRMQGKYKYIKQTLMRMKFRDEFDEFLDAQVKDVENVISLLSSSHTEFVPVTIPESMAVEETKVLLEAIQQYGIRVKNIVLNMVLGSHGCDFCASRKKDQEKYVKQMTDLFSGYNVVHIPMFPGEVKGLKSLTEVWETFSGKSPRHEPTERAEGLEMESPNRIGLNIEELGKRKLLLFGGKGGLGKTTVAAATALRLAETFLDKKVLIFSTDPAQALGRSFGLRVGKEPIQIKKNLFAVAMNADEELKEFKDKYKREIDEVFNAFSSGSGGLDMPFDEEIYKTAIELSPPGLDELMALAEISDLIKKGEYDIFILDTAPSGHALRLLELPELMMDWFRSLVKVIQKYSGVVSLHKTTILILEKMKELKALIELLEDKNQTEFVVVTVPSEVNVAETRRLIARLQKLGISVGRVLINKLHLSSGCDFCRLWRRIELKNIKRIHDEFPNLAMGEMPLFPREIQGIASLTEFSHMLTLQEGMRELITERNF